MVSRTISWLAKLKPLPQNKKKNKKILINMACIHNFHLGLTMPRSLKAKSQPVDMFIHISLCWTSDLNIARVAAMDLWLQ